MVINVKKIRELSIELGTKEGVTSFDNHILALNNCYIL